MGEISFFPGYLRALLIFSFILQAFTSKCPKGWMSYKQHCYKFFGDFLPWLHTEVNCKMAHKNSYLVSIANETEMRRITKWLHPRQISQPIWIGLNHHRGRKRCWRWSDMSTSSYKNWENAKAARYNRKKNCVMMVYHKGALKWYAENCSRPLNFVCKI